MLVHLIISAAFGILAALIGAVSGSGFGSVMLYYVGGCWAGFLLSVCLLLTVRMCLPNPVRTTVGSRRAAF